MAKKVLVISIVALLVLVTALSASPVFGGGGLPGKDGPIPGQFVVLVADGVDPAQVAADYRIQLRHT